MTETMRREGHTALVHTAAASNLGQMLNKICLKDGINLVNIVRNAEQAKILRELGAKHICNSSSPSFLEDLTKALAATGATIAFDAIGGGKLAGQILSCMEAAANLNAKSYSRYGSTVHKQVYIYGRLDTGQTELGRDFGMAWGVGGFLLTPFLQKIGAADVQKLRARVASELKTTFASHYAKVISLQEALQPAIIAAYNKRATGEKYLINPNKAVTVIASEAEAIQLAKVRRAARSCLQWRATRAAGLLRRFARCAMTRINESPLTSPSRPSASRA